MALNKSYVSAMLFKLANDIRNGQYEDVDAVADELRFFGFSIESGAYDE